jgi:hypothetical protein
LLSRFHHNLKYIISLLKKYLQIKAIDSLLKIYSTTYGVGNPCPALREPQKVDGAKNINEIP